MGVKAGQAENPNPTRKRGASRYLAHVSGWACVAIVIWLAPFETAHADSIWLDGESSPLFGIVESSDDQSIVFKQTSDGSTFQSVTISRDKISSVVINFDSQRLSSLVQGDWQLWQNYAEELFSQKQDPVARRLAMRLLVIVAGNAKDAERRNAALNDLIALASSEIQREELLKLRHVETGQKQPVEKVVQPKSLPSAESREAAAKFVQAIRQRRNVSQQLSNEQLKETVSAFSQTCSWQELVQLAKANRIDDQGLRRLVALELELRIADTKSKSSSDNRSSWHLQANRISAKTFGLPTLRSATGFDPEEIRFVEGRWVN